MVEYAKFPNTNKQIAHTKYSFDVAQFSFLVHQGIIVHI